MLQNTLAVPQTHAPGIRYLISHAELLMPYDIETRYGMVGGNWHHGELAVEQILFLRPLPETAQYTTPLPGLWLTGRAIIRAEGSPGRQSGMRLSGLSGRRAIDRPYPLQNPAETDAVSCAHCRCQPAEQLGGLGGLHDVAVLRRRGDGTYRHP